MFSLTPDAVSLTIVLLSQKHTGLKKPSQTIQNESRLSKTSSVNTLLCDLAWEAVGSTVALSVGNSYVSSSEVSPGEVTQVSLWISAACVPSQPGSVGSDVSVLRSCDFYSPLFFLTLCSPPLYPSSSSLSSPQP